MVSCKTFIKKIEFFKQNECILLTLATEYQNLHTPLQFKCKCGLITTKNWDQYRHAPYCKDCSTIKRKKTNNDKYGVDYAIGSDIVRNKSKQTNIDRMGVINPFQNKDIQEKIKKTNLEKYGVEYITQNKNIQEKIKKTNIEKYGVTAPSKNKEIQEKIEKTNMKKYGVVCSLQNKEIQEKIKKTTMERYGVENILKNKEIQKKIKKTIFDRYGVEYITQNKDIQKKIRETNMDRLGVEYPTQHPSVMKKQLHSTYSKQLYLFPSGRSEYVQGYEHLCLDILLQSYNENDIIVDTDNIPVISYNISGETKLRKYFPDIYIPSNNTIIEVKSTYTFDKEYDKNMDKFNKTSKHYKLQVWIFSSKYDKTPVIFYY